MLNPNLPLISTHHILYAVEERSNIIENPMYRLSFYKDVTVEAILGSLTGEDLDNCLKAIKHARKVGLISKGDIVVRATCDATPMLFSDEYKVTETGRSYLARYRVRCNIDAFEVFKLKDGTAGLAFSGTYVSFFATNTLNFAYISGTPKILLSDIEAIIGYSDQDRIRIVRSIFVDIRFALKTHLIHLAGDTFFSAIMESFNSLDSEINNEVPANTEHV